MFKKDDKSVKIVNSSGPFGGVYFLTMVGAAVYFVQQANGFGECIVALFKALVWPAFVIYRVFELLGM